MPARRLKPAASIAARLERVDWAEVARALDERGWATTPPLLTAAECAELIRLYADERRFRSRVDMARFRFGEGEYKYFANPLPPVVRELRRHAYPHLAPIASGWEATLGTNSTLPGRSRGLPRGLRRARADEAHAVAAALRGRAGTTACIRISMARWRFRSR